VDQWEMSVLRSISSEVQKEATAFFVHGPDVVVFYGEEDESVFVFFKEGFD